MRTVDISLCVKVFRLLNTLRVNTYAESSQSVELHTVTILEDLIHLEHQRTDDSQDVGLGYGATLTDTQSEILNTNKVWRHRTGIPITLALAVLTIVLIHTKFD